MFEDVQREYDLPAEDNRAAVKSAADLTAEESFHPLAGYLIQREGAVLSLNKASIDAG